MLLYAFVAGGSIEVIMNGPVGLLFQHTTPPNTNSGANLPCVPRRLGGSPAHILAADIRRCLTSSEADRCDGRADLLIACCEPSAGCLDVVGTLVVIFRQPTTQAPDRVDVTFAVSLPQVLY